MPLQTISPRFVETFQHPPTISARAPGRINLIGEHVDYQNGLVMPAAIDRYVIAEAAPNHRSDIRIGTTAVDQAPLSFEIDQLAPVTGPESWANYVIGVVAKYIDAGVNVSGFDIAIDADLPDGAGLSSSAALESATALVVETLSGSTLTARERALLCQSAEHDFARVPCGIMDQLAVNAGRDDHALMIDCQSLEISALKLPPGLAMLVVDSHVKHALADGEYAKRKADCETAAQTLGVAFLREASTDGVEAARDALGDRVFRRARHVVSEIQRVRDFAAALDAGDLAAIGDLMAASHASLRDDYEVSCNELDSLVDIAKTLGAIGSRMMGGGFGGSTINLVHDDQADHIATEIAQRYSSTCEPFVVHAVRGAETLPCPTS